MSVKNPMFDDFNIIDSPSNKAERNDNRNVKINMSTDTSCNNLENTNNLNVFVSNSKILPMSSADHAILKELEDKHDFPHKRLERKYSINEYINPIDAFSNSKFDLTVLTKSGSKLTISEHTLSLLDMLMPIIKKRVRSFFFVLIVLSFACISIINTSTRSWYIFAISALAIEFACNLGNFLLFQLIDYVLLEHYEMAYRLHAFNGPIGWIISIIIISKIPFQLQQSIKLWDQFISGLLVILFCLCIKQWFERKYYTNLLERRFLDRLLQLDVWIIILSELSCCKPPKTSLLQLRTSGVNSSFSNNKVSNVFIDLVDVANPITEDDTNVIDVTNNYDLLKIFSAYDSDTYITKLKKKTFWLIASRIHKLGGALSLLTYNGTVILRRRKQAKIFAKSLYTHLSKGNKVIINSELIKQCLSNVTYKANPLYPRDFASLHILHNNKIRPRSTSYSALPASEFIPDLLHELTMKLLDPNNTGIINEHQIIQALYKVYKEQRYVNTSLEHLSELHISLKRVVDVVFWFVMLIILQGFLQINLSNLFLPFLTMILTVSFALGPLVGNLFLATTFVFFMMPYDIGHKVAFGVSSDTKLTGFIKNITLLYTTISTLNNETVRVPNHVLFYEKIFNYYESGGACFEIALTFNSLDNLLWDQNKIDLFIQEIKSYVKDRKTEWEDAFTACTSINNHNNTVVYKIWLTHKESLQNFGATANSYTSLLQFIKSLQNTKYQKLKGKYNVDDELYTSPFRVLPMNIPPTIIENSNEVTNSDTVVFPNENTNKII